MHRTDSPDPHPHTKALVFDIPEVAASAPMASTASECCAGLGIDFTRIDVWEDHEAVLAHRVLVGPTIVLLVDGAEIARLSGRRSCRQVRRFFARAGVGMAQTLVVA